MRTEFSFGTHNLHDEAGVPTFFADVVIFTEAIAPTIIALARQKAAHATGRLRGYRIVVCHQQPDLVVAYRRRLFKRRGPLSYTRYVDGRPGVTPDRGTGWLPLELRATGEDVALVFEHRINAAFRPWIRGERQFRESAWRRHTSGTLDTIERLIDSAHFVLAGGDCNTPDDVRAYSLAGVSERGSHFDRLAYGFSRRAHGWKHPGWVMRDAEYLSRKGSDHPRVRVTVIRPGEVTAA